MNAGQKTFVVVLPLLLVAAGCRRSAQPTVAHHRLPNGIYKTRAGCDVNYPSVNLRMSMQEEVEWQSADQQYTVVFQTSPFIDSNHPSQSFTVLANGAVDSGVPVVTGYFEYSIKDSTGNECKSAKDPGVNVKP